MGSNSVVWWGPDLGLGVLVAHELLLLWVKETRPTAGSRVPSTHEPSPSPPPFCLETQNIVRLTWREAACRLVMPVVKETWAFWARGVVGFWSLPGFTLGLEQGVGPLVTCSCSLLLRSGVGLRPPHVRVINPSFPWSCQMKDWQRIFGGRIDGSSYKAYLSPAV